MTHDSWGLLNLIKTTVNQQDSLALWIGSLIVPVYSSIGHPKIVLEILRDSTLPANLSNYSFGHNSMGFLGHIIL